MDFNFLLSKFYSIVDYLKKKKYYFILFFSLFFSVALYFYIDYSMKLESSSSFLRYINQESDDFIKERQYGIYETFRQSIIKKDKNSVKIYSSFDDVFSLYYKFVKQISGDIDDIDGFNSIHESDKCGFCDLFILTKVLYDKSYTKKDIKFMLLNALKQYKEKEKK